MSEEAEVTEAPEQAPMESIARKNGWKPEEEWKGDPPEKGFKSAEEFIRDGFEIQSIQHHKIEKLQTTINSVEGNLKDMAQGEAKRTRKALEGQKDRLEQERQEAFEESDVEAFNKVDKELNETHQQLNEIEEPPRVKEFQAGEKKFLEANDWYGDNKGMTADAMNIAQNLTSMYPNMSPDEYYQEIEKTIKARYPQEFQNQNRNKGGMVSGDKPSSSRSKGEGFDSLPPEAKEAFEEISYYSSLSKDEYAKSYFEQE